MWFDKSKDFYNEGITRWIDPSVFNYLAVGIIEEYIFRQKGKFISTLLRSSPFPREERIIVDKNCSLVLIRASKKDLSWDIYRNIVVQKLIFGI